ncbi:FAD dependent oxidoreductase [Hymenopellis radicata]|nr:FAD dependent oxidoreductase [Hymenopellis radicata]
MAQPTDSILVIGAGCFGISTAYHLLKRGFTDVTVLDRTETLPPVDGSSNDFNRIVRSSYYDPFYSKLAQDAIASWKDRDLFGDSYHESGVLVLGEKDDPHAYAQHAYKNDLAIGQRTKELKDGEEIRLQFPSTVIADVGAFENTSGYINLDNGWAHAAQGVAALTARAAELGGKVIPGKPVSQLLKEGGKTAGVQCKDGSVFKAKYTVIATGAWTASTFPELNTGAFVATGQCVTMVQLTPEEGDAYRDVPVVLHFESGFYCFPPSADNLVKMAIHSRGYTHTQSDISTPRTVISNGDDGLRIPKADVQELRACFKKMYPELAKKPFVRTRLCWYTDTADGDWIIGPHPSDPSLIFATAGNGHAYKFLPVLGRLVADSIQGTMDAETSKRFALDRQIADADHSRAVRTARRELNLDDLCTPEDLLP